MKFNRILSALLAAALVFSLASCGNAPEQEEIPASGDTAAESSEPADVAAEDTTADVPEEEQPKEGTFIEEDGTVHQVTVHEGADGLVTYYIDAEVLGKDITDLPIIEVTSEPFSSEELKAMIAPFVGEYEVYELYGEWQRGDYKRTYVTDYEYHPEEYYDDPERSYYLEPDPNSYEYSAFSMVGDLPRCFNALNRGGVNNFSVGIWSLATGVFIDHYYQSNRFKEEDIERAKADVRSYLDSAGLEEWQFVRYDVRYEGAGKVYLQMKYNLSYNDVPLLRAGEHSGGYLWDVDVSGDLQYHEMLIYYSNDMICTMLLRSPLTVHSETPQTLISYDEAVEAVCREIEANCTADKMQASYEEKFSWSGNTVLSWNVYVDELELVYVRVPMADNPGHYYLIPTWVAYGGHGIDEQIRNNTVVTVGSRYSGNGEPLAFINAIDGTPIDFENGY